MIPFRISCGVTSHSHRLSEDAFSLLTHDATNLQVTHVQERTFMISSINRTVPSDDIGEFAAVAHLSISWFLMALNVASLGHFSWLSNGKVSPHYVVSLLRNIQIYAKQ